MTNYYEVLGVNKDATAEQIKDAYRKLSKKHHPDLNGGSKESEQIFIKVQEAYKVLKNPSSRSSYDAKLGQTTSEETSNHFSRDKESTSKKSPEFNMNNIEKNFEHFFGFNPKTKEMSSNNDKAKKKNPIDTTDLFERFFNK